MALRFDTATTAASTSSSSSNNAPSSRRGFDFGGANAPTAAPTAAPHLNTEARLAAIRKAASTMTSAAAAAHNNPPPRLPFRHAQFFAPPPPVPVPAAAPIASSAAAAAATSNTHNDYDHDDGFDCWVSREYASLAHRGIDAIIHEFTKACKTPDFVEFATHAGFENVTFHPSEQLRAGNPSFDKFVQGLAKLERTAKLGVVFHGTPTANVAHILRDGLDPQKRSGQAYGPGEYFGKSPTISVSYCRGGLEMLVFVVVLPSSIKQTIVDSNNNSNDQRHRTFYGRCPSDMVVVNNNHHQLPIGTMRFTMVDQNVLYQSQTRRQKLLALSREVFHKSQIAKETQTKAAIIQQLIAGKVDVASEMYERKVTFLKDSSKREISWYVHQKLDDDVVCAYFTDLPEPMDFQELENSRIQSVDEVTKIEMEAKQRLEAERKALAAVDPASLSWVNQQTSHLQIRKQQQQQFQFQQQVLQQQQQQQSQFRLQVLQQTRQELTDAVARLASNVTGTLPATSSSTNFSTASTSGSTGLPPRASTTTSTNTNKGQVGSNSSLHTQKPRPDATTRVIQYLIASKPDIASEIFFQNRSYFDAHEKCRKEIAHYAYISVEDIDLVPVLFPGLPPPTDAQRQKNLPSPSKKSKVEHDNNNNKDGPDCAGGGLW